MSHCPCMVRMGPTHRQHKEWARQTGEALLRTLSELKRKQAMSVIGKMYVSEDGSFENGQKVKLSCVCEDKLMAAYHPENENVVFTKYSPWGDATLHFDTPVDFPKVTKTYPAGMESYGYEEGTAYETPCELYMIYVRGDRKPNVEGALFFSKLRVVCKCEFGGDSRSIELSSPYPTTGQVYAANEPRLVSIKLGIDNEAASGQFKPDDVWWVVAHDASVLSQEKALAMVHDLSAEDA